MAASVTSDFNPQHINTFYGFGEPVDIYSFEEENTTKYYSKVEYSPVIDGLDWESDDDFEDKQQALKVALTYNIENTSWIQKLGKRAERLFYLDDFKFYTMFHTIRKGMHKHFPRIKGIYVVSNPLSEAVLYVGITEKSFRKRWKNHNTFEKLKHYDDVIWQYITSCEERCLEEGHMSRDCNYPSYDGLRFDFVDIKSLPFDLDHTEAIMVRCLQPKININLKKQFE